MDCGQLPEGAKLLNDEELNGESFIYFLMLDGQCVYIGQTKNLRARVKDHKVNYDSVYYLWVAPDSRLMAERDYISKLRPEHNHNKLVSSSDIAAEKERRRLERETRKLQRINNRAQLRSIRVSDDQWANWQELASCEGLTISAWLRMLAKREERRTKRANNGLN